MPIHTPAEKAKNKRMTASKKTTTTPKGIKKTTVKKNRK